MLAIEHATFACAASELCFASIRFPCKEPSQQLDQPAIVRMDDDTNAIARYLKLRQLVQSRRCCRIPYQRLYCSMCQARTPQYGDDSRLDDKCAGLPLSLLGHVWRLMTTHLQCQMYACPSNPFQSLQKPAAFQSANLPGCSALKETKWVPVRYLDSYAYLTCSLATFQTLTPFYPDAYACVLSIQKVTW